MFTTNYNDDEDDLKRKNNENEKNNEQKLYGIQEAPKSHPLNESGKLKIIME